MVVHLSYRDTSFCISSSKKKLRRAIQNQRRGLLTAEVTLLHDFARDHTTPSIFVHNLNTLDSKLLLHLKRFLSGRRLESDEGVVLIQKLVSRYDKCLDKNGDGNKDILISYSSFFLFGRLCNYLQNIESEMYRILGATDAIRSILKLFSNTGGKKGVMVSVPVFPAYTAFITELDLVPMFYCLDENKNWALNIKDLKKVIKKGRKVCDPAVLVVINPGNPTGQVLTRKNIEELIKFAYKNNLLIIADEIYQDNVYTGEFHSFKKVV